MSKYASLREANVARQQEWDQDNKITLAYRGNELAGEVGEACNVIKKIERERIGIRGSRATISQLAEELADVVICTDLIAMHAGIDLERAVAEKFNATSVNNNLTTRLRASHNAEEDELNEMVVRVAKAICANTDWQVICADTNWQDLTGLAHNAIAAMREPTKMMTAVGWDSFGSEGREPHPEVISNAYRQMIDEALRSANEPDERQKRMLQHMVADEIPL